MGQSTRNNTSARLCALGLSVMLFAGSFAHPAYADAPKVQVDETLYVNTDSYGKPTGVSVVKSVGMNGRNSFVDYGEYTDIINMTNLTEPKYENGKITWNVGDDVNRFYYEGRMDQNTVEIPWTFDISYKLNGVPKKAEELLGASGLVEIHIKADPNPRAGAYYRNNMLLMAAVPVDMEKCYSVDAPGSQTQTMGSYTGVIFMALPGEEGDFTVRLGTDDFSSVGVIMTMMPGTLEDLGRIKDLKEAKDTWRENGDKLYESIDDLMAAMEGMKEDVKTARDGTKNLQNAQQIISGNRKQTEALSAQAIAELGTLTQETAELVPYLQTARTAVSDMNYNVDAMYNALESTQDDLDTLYDRLRSLQRALYSASNGADAAAVTENDRAEIGRIAKDIITVNGDLAEGATHIGAVGDEVKKHAAEAKAAAENITKGERAQAIKREIARAASDSNLPKEQQAAIYRSVEEYEAAINQTVVDFSTDVENSRITKTFNHVTKTVDDSVPLINDLNGAVMRSSKIVDDVNMALGLTSGVAYQTGRTVGTLRTVDDDLIYLIDDVRVLIDTMDSYVPDVLDGLTDTEDTLNALTGTMATTHALLSTVNGTLTAAGDSLDAGSRKTLKAMQGTLTNTLSMLDDIGEVRAAGQAMKQTLDDELDRLEEETSFLNMDPDARKQSFTSALNAEPHSLQIVVRTGEISEDTQPTDITDEEAEPEDVGVLARIWTVFKKIFDAIASLFNR